MGTGSGANPISRLMMLWMFTGLLGSLSSTLANRSPDPAGGSPIGRQPSIPISPIEPCRLPHWPKISDAFRYPNLFQSENKIRTMVERRKIREYFKMGRVKARYHFPGVCDNPQNPFREFTHLFNVKNRVMTIPQCAEPLPVLTHSSPKSMSDPCCETNMSITIPATVESLYTGASLQVKHLTNSYQYLHEGQCVSHNAPCDHGTCRLTERIQWVLVVKNGKDMFVPVSVGNHCYCSYH